MMVTRLGGTPRESLTSRACGVHWAAALAIGAGLLSLSAEAWAAEILPALKYDLETGAFDGTLPHRTEFLVHVHVPAAYNRVNFAYWPADGRKCGARPENFASAWGVNHEAPAEGAPVRTVVVKVPALDFSQGYCFSAQLGRQWSSADAQGVVDGLSATLATLQATGKLRAEEDVRAAVRLHIRDAAKLQVMVEGKRPEALDAYLAAWLFKQLSEQQLAQTQDDLRSALSNVATYRDQLGLEVTQGELATKPAAGSPAAAVTDETRSSLQRAAETLQSARARLPHSALAPAELLKKPTNLDELQVAAQQWVSTTATVCGKPPLLDKTCASRLQAQHLVRVIDDATNARRALADKLAEIELSSANLVDQLRTVATDAAPAAAITSAPSYTDRSTFYIAGDVGAVLPLFFKDKVSNPDADYALFVGASFYFIPVDKSKPLSLEDSGWHRFSLCAGVTLNDIRDPSRSARGALDGKGALVGVGVRITDYLRLGAGAMLIRQKPGNPLSSEDALRATPYVSASIDVDVVGTVSGFFKKPSQL